MSTLKLKGGTSIVVNGHPAVLGADTDVECATEHFQALREHSTTPYIEYPKALPDGRTVASAAEEAPLPPQVDAVTERPDPLDDIEVEMDNPDFEQPKKPTHKKK